VRLAHFANLASRRPIIRYACVGGIAACVDIAFFALFAKHLGYPYLWVAAIGFLLATLVNYILSIFFVFADRRRHKRSTEIGLVYFVSLLGLGLHQLILFWSVEHAGAGLMISKFIATGTVFIWNYLARKYYIFAERPLA
jgi:putative flippase GtrA